MKKIALIRPGIHPLDIDFASTLAAVGYHVDLIAPKNGIVLYLPQSINNFNIILLDSINIPNFIDLPIPMKLFRLLNSKKYDIIQPSEDFQPMSMIAAYFAAKYKKKLILIAEKYTYSRHPLNRIVFWVFDFIGITKYVIKRTNTIIAHGSETFKYLLNRDIKTKIVQIPSSIKSELYKSKLDYKIPETIKILIVARLIPQKGLDVLFKALQRIRSKYILTIIGDGPLKKMLLALSRELGIENNIHIVSNINRDDVNEIMIQSDLYICSSKFEPASIALLEAMAVGLPVISTDAGNTKDYVFEGQNGYLFKSEDYVDLANKIGIIIKQDQFKSLGRKSAELARSKFNIDLRIKDYIKLFEE